MALHENHDTCSNTTATVLGDETGPIRDLDEMRAVALIASCLLYCTNECVDMDAEVDRVLSTADRLLIWLE